MVPEVVLVVLVLVVLVVVLVLVVSCRATAGAMVGRRLVNLE